MPAGLVGQTVLLTVVAMQVLQAKSAAATSVERDAVIHSQLHHPNIIGFKKVRTYLCIMVYATCPLVWNNSPIKRRPYNTRPPVVSQGVAFLRDVLEIANCIDQALSSAGDAVAPGSKRCEFPADILEQ